MNPLLHTLNIGTLATWLSVGSFGTVGVLIPAWQAGHLDPLKSEIETLSVEPDISLGDPDSTEPTSSSAAAESHTLAEETLPLPPEIPELSEHSPLPEIPELPAPAPAKTSAANNAPPRKSTATSSHNATRPSTSTGGNTNRTGVAANGSPGGSGMSESARLAAGRMPPPVYPSEARRKGQTGTVMVEFVVDSSGRVISAYAKSPTPWPLLNHEAVRAVRRWKFPAGTVMKIQRPIVFQLR